MRWITTTAASASSTLDSAEWMATTEREDGVGDSTESSVNERETDVNKYKSEKSSADDFGTTELASIVNYDSTEPSEPEKYKCGIRSNEDFPWIVILVHTDPYSPNEKSRKTLSKGVLISPQHVLTTVSSVFNSNPFWVV